MKRSAVVGLQFKHDGLNPGAALTTVVANLLPGIEIDIEFEELEEKTAPQSDTSYLDSIGAAGQRRLV